MITLRVAGATAVLAALFACSPRPTAVTQARGDSRYLYLWAAAGDSTAPDFLSVLDVAPDTGRYGSFLATLPVPGRNNGPHHTEHEMPADGQLFANGFGSGQSFIFDLANPQQPRLAGLFGAVAGMHHPHSFLRLPGGNVLATFQMSHDSAGMAPGGLVEMTPAGKVVRSASAAGPGVPRGLRPYSAVIVPALDRIVTTTTDMDEKNPYQARELQLWRLSDLALLHTFTLPPGPRGDEADYSAEPRLLADGRTVLVSTFSCGLYLLEGLDTDRPSGRLVASFPRKKDTWCAIPVVTGRWYLVTVPAWSGVVSLDISNPAAPREAGRVVLDSADVPHWISLEPNSRRLVITGFGALEHRVLIASFDSATGALALDGRFREPGATAPGFTLPGRAVPHGAVLSRPPQEQ